MFLMPSVIMPIRARQREKYGVVLILTGHDPHWASWPVAAGLLASRRPPGYCASQIRAAKQPEPLKRRRDKGLQRKGASWIPDSCSEIEKYWRKRIY
jgi:hypothetical protein